MKLIFFSCLKNNENLSMHINVYLIKTLIKQLETYNFLSFCNKIINEEKPFLFYIA